MGLACSTPLNGRDEPAPTAADAAAAQDSLPLIEHLAPKRDSTGGVPTRFEWSAVKGTDEYIISMYDDIDILLWRQHVKGTSVDWPKPLTVPEGTYFWDVAAVRNEQVIGRAGRAAFVILDKK
jgi:hypothetical protein